jgi:hypothetical protein
MTTLTLRDYVEMVLEGYTLDPGARKILETAVSKEPAMSPKLVSGTSERSCDTCNHRKRRMHEEPCRSCHGYSNWEQEQ